MNRMKKQRARSEAILLLLLCMAMLLTGCHISVFAYDPPTVEDAEDWLEDNQKEILTIVNYLTGKTADDIYIDGPDVKVFSDFDHVELDDPEVKKCVERLWKHGCMSITKGTDNNSISFEIWSRSIGEAQAGIALSMDGENLPDENYCTELHALSEDGWFYYVADYELWRVQQQNGAGALN